MSSAIVACLLDAGIGLGCAVLPALLLRMPLRRLCGPEAAYACWLVPPAIVLAGLVPAAPLPLVAAHVDWQHALALPPASVPGAALTWTDAALLAWLAGAALYGLALYRGHTRFLRTLGPLRERRGIFHTRAPVAGALLIGWLRPRIVVAEDFRDRYPARERRLLLAHERVHLRRGDVACNLLVAALQCVFWFQPLLHVAAAYLRRDQELACDAAVLRRFGGARRAYGHLLLDTQLAAQSTPFACGWQSNHPLTETIMHLNRRSPVSPAIARRIVGAVIAASAATAWALQPAATRDYDLALTLQADGATATPRLRVREGEPFAVAIGDGAQRWHAASVLHLRADGTADLTMALKQGDRQVAEPRIVTRLGERAGIAVDGRYRLAVTVTPAP